MSNVIQQTNPRAFLRTRWLRLRKCHTFFVLHDKLCGLPWPSPQEEAQTKKGGQPGLASPAEDAEGLARSGRSLEEITFSVPIMTAVGDSDEELEKTREHARMMIAFYGSTPGYEAMFEHHGYNGLGEELQLRGLREHA